MERYSLAEAQDHLRKPIDEAQHGKTVVILDDDNRAVQLVPVATEARPRRAGSARGLISMSPDFDDTSLA